MGRRIALALLVGAACLSAFGLAACSSGDTPKEPQAQLPSADGGGGPRVSVSGHVTAASPDERADGAAAPQDTGPRGPAIEVTWEALAHERYLLENSRFRRPGQPTPPQKITLLSKSHPDASRAKAAATQAEREAYAGTAVLEDRDMIGLLQGLERSGYFKYARALGYDDSLAGGDNARGRVIVKRGDQSWSLLSMRGQGGNPQTKEIPRIYSESKQAIMVLRNMTPTLNVTHFGTSGTAPLR